MANLNDKREREIQQAIFRIATILNGVNKKFAEFKGAIIEAKRNLLILNQDFVIAKVAEDNFRISAITIIQQIIEKTDGLKDDFELIFRRCDAAKRIIHAELETDKSNQLTATLASNLQNTEDRLLRHRNRLEIIEDMLRQFEQILSNQSIILNPQQMERVINSTFDRSHDIFVEIEKATKGEMKVIIDVYTLHFKLYRLSQISCPKCGTENPHNARYCHNCSAELK